MTQDQVFHSQIGDVPSAPITDQVKSQVLVVQNQSPQLGPNPQQVKCPSCHQTRVSTIIHENTMKTHLIAAILASSCCCCIPYLMDTCKSTEHICQSCGAYLGKYDK